MKKGDYPKFKHDCDKCIFIQNTPNHDLYLCAQGGHLVTMVARWGEEGPDYDSVPFETVLSGGHPLFRSK